MNSPKKLQTHCKRGHEFTKENTHIQIINGIECRGCKICRNINTLNSVDNNREHHNQWQRKWRKLNPDKIENYKAKQLTRYAKKKLSVISHYSPKLCCVCCGEDEFKFLSIDHINNDGNIHKKQNNNLKGGTPMYYWIIKHNFPQGFQVLCMNCNFGKRMNKGICPHKTPNSNIKISQTWISN